MTHKNTDAMPQDVCAVVLAGGRGQRMGGLDKGLQTYGGSTLVENAVRRLRTQSGCAPCCIGINANRNLEHYTSLGLPVWPDTLPDFAGPLAGFLSALEHNAQQARPCELVLTVPCDSPLFPLNLLTRLVQAMEQAHAEIAMACAPEASESGETVLRRQPVFSLIRSELVTSLRRYLDSGGRKIDTWFQQHALVEVPFDRSDDDVHAFANANTLEELRQLDTP